MSIVKKDLLVLYLIIFASLTFFVLFSENISSQQWSLFILGVTILLSIKIKTITQKNINEREYFLKVLNHDLRVCSLALIRGVELLNKNGLHNSEKEEILQELDSSCKYNLEMLSLLIKTFKYYQGENVLNLQKIDLKHLLNKIYSFNENLLKSKNLSLIQELNYIDFLECDVKSIYKMISIFLQTAISNSFNNSTIEIKTNKIKNKIKISITYQGKKISEEEFCRLLAKPARFTTVGQGIKMDFCRKTLDFHNGKIEFKHSSNMNNLIFTLPLLQKQKHIKTLVLPKIHDLKQSITT